MVKSRNHFWLCAGILTVVVSFRLIDSSFGAPQQMYAGPRRAANESALIRGATKEVNIESCDGVKVTSLEISVLPGEHVLEMSYVGSISYSTENSFKKFSVEAGHTYTMDWTQGQAPASYTVVVKDITTGKMVNATGWYDRKIAAQRAETWRRKTKEFPQDGNAWGSLGDMLLILEKYEESLAAFESCISIFPNSPLGWRKKSEALLGLKRNDEALTAIEKAIQFRPGDDEFKQFKENIIKAMSRKE